MLCICQSSVDSKRCGRPPRPPSLSPKRQVQNWIHFHSEGIRRKPRSRTSPADLPDSQHSLKMNSIQVYTDLPSVEYQDDIWIGTWQHDTTLPSIHHYLEAIDTSFHGMKSHQYEGHGLAMPSTGPLSYRDSVFSIHSQNYQQPVYQPLRGHEQHVHSTWSAPSIRLPYPMGAYDDPSFPSDHSSAPSEDPTSPRMSVGQLTSPTSDYDDSGPLTPPLSNIRGGNPHTVQTQPIQYESHYPSHGVSVTMRDIQYERDLDEQAAYHMGLSPEKWDIHRIQPSEAQYVTPESTADVEEVDSTIDDDTASEYTPISQRPSRKSTTQQNVTAPSKNPRFPRSSKVMTQSNTNGVKKSKTKSKTHSRRSSTNQTIISQASQLQRRSTEKRRFTCSFAHYGCKSTFANKNEWKRHVSSQHLQLGFYRCDLPPCNALSPSPSHGHGTHSHVKTRDQEEHPVYNDFNRKDLFTQHLRRMHSPWDPKVPQPMSTPATSNTSKMVSRNQKPYTPSQQEKVSFEASLEPIRQRCWHQSRYPPRRSVCGFCHKSFEGESSWDDRMEHVGRHLEDAANAAAAASDDDDAMADEYTDDNNEKEDPELTKWAVEEGVIEWNAAKGMWNLC